MTLVLIPSYYLVVIAAWFADLFKLDVCTSRPIIPCVEHTHSHTQTATHSSDSVLTCLHPVVPFLFLLCLSKGSETQNPVNQPLRAQKPFGEAGHQTEDISHIMRRLPSPGCPRHFASASPESCQEDQRVFFGMGNHQHEYKRIKVLHVVHRDIQPQCHGRVRFTTLHSGSIQSTAYKKGKKKKKQSLLTT